MPAIGVAGDITKNTWKMHVISNPNEKLPNGLSEVDCNGDGLPDYVTNYESNGNIRIAFHPGLQEVKEPWPTVVVGNVPNAESAAFGDFDDDGRPDVVVAHGVEHTDRQSGVFIIWGPAVADQSMDAHAWKMSEDIPSSINGGQYTYVNSQDVNKDGVDDIIIGGRRNGRARHGDRPYSPEDIFTGLKWFKAPQQHTDRRDPSKWSVHYIDPELKGSFGPQFADIDGDGDDDIVVTNADWDTRKHDRMIIWYENPGSGSLAQLGIWNKHIVYHGDEFFTKPQVVPGDLNGDGQTDIVIQPSKESVIYYFENQGGTQVEFKRVEIEKAPETQWLSRPTKLFDINADGKMDIIGMLIHKDSRLPSDKAAVFWMEFQGKYPMATNWTSHVVKWGGDFVGNGLFNGEKWDQCIFRDVDQDGDVDIVANCEEYHDQDTVYIGVVWFENPGKE
jgi:hypothetical protein